MSTMVGVSPAVSVFDSMNVILPGMSISKRCICHEKNTLTECYHECFRIQHKACMLVEDFLNSRDNFNGIF